MLIERASPWPKFDKAVSELHDWLNTLSDMMKTEKIVLGDSEDMEGLLEKQKVIVRYASFPSEVIRTTFALWTWPKYYREHRSDGTAL